MGNALKGRLGFKGEPGYSAYEVAVLNGFIGTEKDWLARLGTSSHFEREEVTEISTVENQRFFALPSAYTSDSFLDVYVDGERLNTEEYQINTESNQIYLANGLSVIGTRVDIVVLTMSTNNLPIVETLEENSTNDEVLGAKSLFDLLTINVKNFGAVGDGSADDTEAIQKAIDYANTKNRKVYIPVGTYLITDSIVLNGCSLLGETSNIFNEAGSVIVCSTNTFTAIKQGSLASTDIQFNVSDILVKNANVGYEFNYVINSKFERLYAYNCDIGFKLGDSSAVGSMFCEFNNLYTKECRVGIESLNSKHFNNNRFNNGYIQGNDYAMSLKVNGGYGAVGNVFNNVEFKSATGRGIVLTSALNTTFNSCYFECGGNAVRAKDYCTLALKNCVYGLFKTLNANGDTNVVFAEGGIELNIDNGIIFLTDEYANVYFYGATNTSTYDNITLTKSITKNGSATGFAFFSQKIKEIQYKTEERTALTGTVTAKANSTTNVSFTYNEAFSKDPNVVCVTMRGASGISNGLSYIVSERTKTGGTISIYNSIASDRSISFSIYAKSV